MRAITEASGGVAESAIACRRPSADFNLRAIVPAPSPTKGRSGRDPLVPSTFPVLVQQRLRQRDDGCRSGPLASSYRAAYTSPRQASTQVTIPDATANPPADSRAARASASRPETPTSGFRHRKRQALHRRDTDPQPCKRSRAGCDGEDVDRLECECPHVPAAPSGRLAGARPADDSRSLASSHSRSWSRTSAQLPARVVVSSARMSIGVER